jgi:hypothetical protein
MDTATLLDLSSSWKYAENLEDTAQKRLGEPDGYYCPWEQGQDFARLDLPGDVPDEHRHMIREILFFWGKQPNVYHDSVSHIIFCWNLEQLYILKNSLIAPTPKSIVHVVWLDSLSKFEIFQVLQRKREVERRRWFTIGWGLLWFGAAVLIEDFKLS